MSPYASREGDPTIILSNVAVGTPMHREINVHVSPMMHKRRDNENSCLHMQAVKAISPSYCYTNPPKEPTTMKSLRRCCWTSTHQKEQCPRHGRPSSDSNDAQVPARSREHISRSCSSIDFKHMSGGAHGGI